MENRIRIHRMTDSIFRVRDDLGLFSVPHKQPF
jgi:hypothetical protein